MSPRDHFTNAVVAIDVSLSVRAGLGAVGFPVKIGEAIFALSPIAEVTNAVVAIDVSLSHTTRVGAFGSPVNIGLASVA